MGLRTFLAAILQDVIPGAWKRKPGERRSSSRYLRLWRFTVLITAGASLTPLIVIGALDFYQDQRAFKNELIRPVLRLTSATKRSMEAFLGERRSALDFIIHEKSFEDLSDQQELSHLFANMKTAFGGFVDLGLIDSKGEQISYVGPYQLLGKDYQDQDWFHEVDLRGIYVSDVFMGYRKFPHFVIAVKYKKGDRDFYVLRATIDTEALNQQILSLGLRPSSDAFIINRGGKLQTPSKLFGDVLEVISMPVPPFSGRPEVIEEYDVGKRTPILGYAYIEHSPFIFVMIKEPQALMGSWFTLRSRRIGFLAVSVVAILVLIMGTSSYLVARIQEADLKHAKVLHNIQYTSKMASIGRLAAGVAHEVNNPLAIINEKAGLAKDLTSLLDDFPQKEKFLKLMESILASVERCSTITHRLLGFAKRMDTQMETIDLEILLKEVLGFLEREVSYRNVSINFHVSDTLPSIESDRGQLQQVFLNIINNAVEELQSGGRIDISMQEEENDMVAITIADNGQGIPKENLRQIFEPFFTTKKEYGTGLGLSITYGIVEKLGGEIKVKSEMGQGTSFTVTLPVRKSSL